MMTSGTGGGPGARCPPAAPQRAVPQLRVPVVKGSVRVPAMAMIRQCLLKRGTWYTVAWVPEDQAVIGKEVEIVMMHDTGRTEDERRVLEGRREWWTVAEKWTLLPTGESDARTPHRDGHHSQNDAPHEPHHAPQHGAPRSVKPGAQARPSGS